MHQRLKFSLKYFEKINENRVTSSGYTRLIFWLSSKPKLEKKIKSDVSKVFFVVNLENIFSKIISFVWQFSESNISFKIVSYYIMYVMSLFLLSPHFWYLLSFSGVLRDIKNNILFLLHREQESFWIKWFYIQWVTYQSQGQT